jgi:hypothetical protein
MMVMKKGLRFLIIVLVIFILVAAQAVVRAVPATSVDGSHRSLPAEEPASYSELNNLAQIQPPLDPRVEAVKRLTARELADLVNRDYPGWLISLPSCPCRREDINPSNFVESSWWARRYRNYIDYHPGADHDYRQTEATLGEYRSPTNPNAVPIRPGQQCTYDRGGKLITRGPGAGTPDLFGPEGTENYSYLHTFWDVNPFHEIVGDSESQIRDNSIGLREYHRTWTPNPGRSQTGEPCPINPSPDVRSGNQRQGRNFGDPHLFTFDGYRYSFQSVGEFILAKSDDDLFEIQVRQSPINGSLSVDSAIAMRIANDRVSLYADESPDGNIDFPLWVNGIPTTVDRELTLSAGGKIYRQGSDYIFEWPTGEELIAQVNRSEDNPFINITVYVFQSQANHISGLLGNANGNAEDDLRFRSGDVLPSRDAYGDIESIIRSASPIRLPLNSAFNLYLERLTKDYGSDWRLSQFESLFDYATGQSTQTFTLENFPDEYLALDNLSSNELSTARTICIDRGVEPELMEGCIFDVAFSGRSDFARAAARVSQVADILRDFGIDIPDIENEIRNRLPRLPRGIRIPGLPF